MLIEKLPKLFQSNALMVNLAELTQGNKILFSSIVYVNQAKSYIIKKTEKTPYFEQDWQLYSFYRSYANTSITTGIFHTKEGAILRTEKDIFKSYFASGDKGIEEMYLNFRANQKQNVYVMTRTMSREEILAHFNTDLYSVVEEDFTKDEGDHPNQDDLSKILKGILRTSRAPILIQGGPVIMKNYFESLRKATSKNLIDGGYIAYFQGNLPQQCIGNEFQFDQNLFKQLWRTQKFKVDWKGQSIGTVYFKFFQGKFK